ncbi:hypothetical protein Dimus_036849, partial [Dionaea muscipula]
MLGGRVITDRRSSLLPKTVEALICTQSWMNNVLTIVGDEVEVILDDDGAKQAERIAAEEMRDCDCETVSRMRAA